MASESGCPIEFHRIDVDKCDPVFDKECQGNKYIPFLRADYDRQTGRSPNSPREQVIPTFLELTGSDLADHSTGLTSGSGRLSTLSCVTFASYDNDTERPNRSLSKLQYV